MNTLVFLALVGVPIPVWAPIVGALGGVVFAWALIAIPQRLASRRAKLEAYAESDRRAALLTKDARPMRRGIASLVKRSVDSWEDRP